VRSLRRDETIPSFQIFSSAFTLPPIRLITVKDATARPGDPLPQSQPVRGIG
jgi:hypothetical protein